MACGGGVRVRADLKRHWDKAGRGSLGDMSALSDGQSEPGVAAPEPTTVSAAAPEPDDALAAFGSTLLDGGSTIVTHYHDGVEARADDATVETNESRRRDEIKRRHEKKQEKRRGP